LAKPIEEAHAAARRHLDGRTDWTDLVADATMRTAAPESAASRVASATSSHQSASFPRKPGHRPFGCSDCGY
jgi:hypothetical protein